ncbi:hypothetical protein OsJ_07723 [Oryza sativa Japonica Group]|uniref:Uncharacterized protein n=1 Tax=Oryza sativa subsp. japonica TaxID=39947 RepID=A3A9L1_ORYSJ|nr:hypothetical protein OsJ_07723 [Oryza sativa Japonica Group]
MASPSPCSPLCLTRSNSSARPNPPSPLTLSGLKLLVVALSSANVKIHRLGTSRILQSGLRVERPGDADDCTAGCSQGHIVAATAATW